MVTLLPLIDSTPSVIGKSMAPTSLQSSALLALVDNAISDAWDPPKSAITLEVVAKVSNQVSMICESSLVYTTVSETDLRHFIERYLHIGTATLSNRVGVVVLTCSLVLGFRARADLMQPDRILDVWTEIVSRHSLLASTVEYTDVRNIRFW